VEPREKLLKKAEVTIGPLLLSPPTVMLYCLKENIKAKGLNNVSCVQKSERMLIFIELLSHRIDF
jgi:hypothetical protein